MSRDYDAIFKATQDVQTAITKSEVISLPPGYLVGFDIRLRKDYTVLVGAGAANVSGSLVQKGESHQLEEADWVAPKISSTRHYYIYITKDGSYKVDIVAPVWNESLLYYEQPDMNWRAIGKIFLASGRIVYAIKQVELSGSTVTVAPEGFTGEADYYCDGDNDQILINAAIRYLHGTHDGGVVTFLPGEYYTSDIIDLSYNNITLQGNSAIINAYSEVVDVFRAVGISGSNISNVKIIGFKITGAGASTDAIKVSYVDECVIENNYIDATCLYGIYAYNAGRVNIKGNTAISLVSSGFYISSDYAIVTNNRAISNGYGINVAGDYCSITNNYCSGNTSVGLHVQIYYSTSVIGNYCYGNGSDTGIANTNSDNFIDEGTDTQVYSNSWQSPVSGEPEQGQLHWLPQSTSTGHAIFGTSGVTTTAVWSSVSLGTWVPVGTKSIYANIYVSAGASAVGQVEHRVFFSNNPSTTAPFVWQSHPGVDLYWPAAGSGIAMQIMYPMFIPITPDRKFYHYSDVRTNATACIIYGALLGYTS